MNDEDEIDDDDEDAGDDDGDGDDRDGDIWPMRAETHPPHTKQKVPTERYLLAPKQNDSKTHIYFV